MDVPFVPGDYSVGCVVAVPVRTEVGIVSHKGLLSDQWGPDGCPRVIHAAKLYGAIVESTMSEFMLKAEGPVCSEGYPSQLPAELVLARARSEISQPWRLFHNCEHFVAWSHDLPVRSPQLRARAKKAGGIGAIAIGLLVARAIL